MENGGENTKRKPHSDIVGKTNIKGDLINTAPAEDWEFLHDNTGHAYLDMVAYSK